MKVMHLLAISIAAVSILASSSNGQTVDLEKSATPVADGKFRLEVGSDEMPSIKNTLVAKLKVETGKSAKDLGTRLEFRYLDKSSVNSWAGGLKRKAGSQEIFFVFQFSSVVDNRSTEHPLFAYSIDQDTALSSGMFSAPGMTKLEDVFKLTATSGDYDIRQPLEIGTFGGKPVVLRVEPPNGWGDAVNANVHPEK